MFHQVCCFKVIIVLNFSITTTFKPPGSDIYKTLEHTQTFLSPTAIMMFTVAVYYSGLQSSLRISIIISHEKGF